MDGETLRKDYARARRLAIDAAVNFLQIDRQEFARLIKAWPEVSRQLWETHQREAFYRAWTGDVGRANLAANIEDQFSRLPIYQICRRVIDEAQVKEVLDFGCGTGALAFALIPHLPAESLMVAADFPNLASEFVEWRIAKSQLEDTVYAMTPEEVAADLEDSFDFVICIDVLEHVAESFRTLKTLIRCLHTGGHLLLRHPWSTGEGDFHEHLVEARDNWFQNNQGPYLLAQTTREITSFRAGGLYRKVV